MKVVSTSVMAALVVLALFWGNCLSCPQMLAGLSSRQPAHGCCHHKEQPVKTECQSQALQHFVKAPSTDPTPAPQVIAEQVVSAVVVLTAEMTPVVAEIIDETPPDLISLHSSFRI